MCRPSTFTFSAHAITITCFILDNYIDATNSKLYFLYNNRPRYISMWILNFIFLDCQSSVGNDKTTIIFYWSSILFSHKMHCFRYLSKTRAMTRGCFIHTFWWHVAFIVQTPSRRSYSTRPQTSLDTDVSHTHKIGQYWSILNKYRRFYLLSGALRSSSCEGSRLFSGEVHVQWDAVLFKFTAARLLPKCIWLVKVTWNAFLHQLQLRYYL